MRNFHHHEEFLSPWLIFTTIITFHHSEKIFIDWWLFIIMVFFHHKFIFWCNRNYEFDPSDRVCITMRNFHHNGKCSTESCSLFIVIDSKTMMNFQHSNETSLSIQRSLITNWWIFIIMMYFHPMLKFWCNHKFSSPW